MVLTCQRVGLVGGTLCLRAPPAVCEGLVRGARWGERGRREDGAGSIAAVGTSSFWAMRLRLREGGMMSLLGSEGLDLCVASWGECGAMCILQVRVSVERTTVCDLAVQCICASWGAMLILQLRLEVEL